MTQKQPSRIERPRCFVCNTTKTYFDKQGLEHLHVKQLRQDKYLCYLCYQKHKYQKNKAKILSIRRRQRDKNRIVPFKHRAPWRSVTSGKRVRKRPVLNFELTD